MNPRQSMRLSADAEEKLKSDSLPCYLDLFTEGNMDIRLNRAHIRLNPKTSYLKFGASVW